MFIVSCPDRKNICAFYVTAHDICLPPQVIIPPEGYLKAVRDLCSKYNILMIADEIQSGLARSGRLLACDWEEVRPDVVVRTLVVLIRQLTLFEHMQLA